VVRVRRKQVRPTQGWPTVIHIPADLREAMVGQAVRELPDEACGLLAGRTTDGEARTEHLFPMTNADHSPMTYRLDAEEQLRAFNEIEQKGWDLVGIFHSHTHTEAYPSETDRRQAFYPEAHYVVVSLLDRNNPLLRAFTIRDGRVEEQEVTIT
jgi:proteasome lid subunit RPN8/RPN11